MRCKKYVDTAKKCKDSKEKDCGKKEYCDVFKNISAKDFAKCFNDHKKDVGDEEDPDIPEDVAKHFLEEAKKEC